MVTLDRLRYFVRAATLEHVGNAARQLAVSPSVVSAAIRELEEELGQALFLREKQRIKLTERGLILLEKAKVILRETDELFADLGSENQQIKGHFRIGASHFLMQEYLVEALVEIKKQHPELTVEFFSLDSGVAVSRILSGELDAALVFRSSYYHEVNETVLRNGQFQIAVRKNHPLLKLPRKLITENLNELPAITFRTLSGPNFWENHPAFRNAGITPKHTFFYEDTETALQLLQKTNGWAFLPDEVIRRNGKIQRVNLPGPLNAPVNISWITKKDRPSRSFLDRVKEMLLLEIER